MVMVSLETTSHGRLEVGVEYSNPLFVAQGSCNVRRPSDAIARRQTFAITPSRCRTVVDENPRVMACVAGVVCATVFFVVPIMALFEAPIVSMDYPKSKRMALLLYAGVLQPRLIMYLVSRRARQKHAVLFQFALNHVAGLPDVQFAFLPQALFRSVHLGPNHSMVR